jgi:hypothetical protein
VSDEIARRENDARAFDVTRVELAFFERGEFVTRNEQDAAAKSLRGVAIFGLGELHEQPVVRRTRRRKLHEAFFAFGCAQARGGLEQEQIGMLVVELEANFASDSVSASDFRDWDEQSVCRSG